jgi:hypothetical protein
MKQDQSTLLSLALAATAAGDVTAKNTPPQFDSDKSVATTDFVQRALGNKASMLVIPSAMSLTAAHAGMALVTGGTGYTVTLPPISTLAEGAIISITNSGTGPVTIAPNGADIIDPGFNSVANFTIPLGDHIDFECSKSGTRWFFHGTGNLANSAQFERSTANAGYQKLPGGLIIQWFKLETLGVQGATSTFPTPFPTACLGVFVTCANGSSPIAMSVSNVSATNFKVYATTVPVGFSAFAVGY